MKAHRITAEALPGDAGAVYGGTYLPGVRVSEALAQAEIDWPVSKSPIALCPQPYGDDILEIEVSMKDGARTPIPGWKALYRKTKDKDPNTGRAINEFLGMRPPDGYMIEGQQATRRETRALGIVKGRYQQIQNVDAFKWIDLCLDANPTWEIIAAGELFGGKQTWVCVSLGTFFIGEDQIAKHMLVVNSHDGTSNLTVKFIPFRVASATILTSSDEYHIRHCSEASFKLSQVREIVAAAERDFATFEGLFNRFLAKTVDIADQCRIIKRSLGVKDAGDGEGKKPQWINLLDEILRTITVAPGHEHGAGTVWATYTGIATWADHVRHVRGSEDNPDLIIESKLNGHSAKLKVESFSACRHELGRTPTEEFQQFMQTR